MRTPLSLLVVVLGCDGPDGTSGDDAPDGGAAVGVDAFLDVIDGDWGAGADDNAPDDVLAGQSYAGYAADATFLCWRATCSPAP